MLGGMTARKVKLSISLDADVVDAIDRHAANEGATRSAVMERWLRQASGRARAARLSEETAAYYEGLTASERAEDAALAAASAHAARRLRVDEAPASARRPGVKRRG
jgi:metal-responsive CopG/Arc/MetJ family transcriptional regulator